MSASASSWSNDEPRRLAGWIAPTLAIAALAIVVLGHIAGANALPTAIAGGLLLVVSLVLYPTLGSVLFIAVAWANAPVVVTREAGNPWLLGALASVLLLVPAFVQVYVLRRGWVLDTPFLWMMLFLGALLLSTLVARDYGVAFAWLGTYAAEGLLLYLLVANAIRDRSALRRVLWAMLAICAVLSVLSIYQEVTRNYEQTFGGFASRKLEHGIKAEALDSTGLVRSRERVGAEDRACGPVNDPNHFAQILLVALPVGLMLAWSERKGAAKLVAFLLCAIVLGGILLTYSRGGFLALVMLLVSLVAFGYLRVKHVLIGATALTGLVFAVAPGYLERMDSIRGVSDMDTVNDQAMRGRLTEMLAAWNVLLDHPLVGVGPGQYTPFYSMDYMDDPGVAYRQIEKERRAHSLYFELGAETGLLGLALFLGLSIEVLRRLQRVRRTGPRNSESVHLATGLGLGMLTYLGTSFFLSLAFMRYWWLVVALACVAVRLARPSPSQMQTDLKATLREAAG